MIEVAAILIGAETVRRRWWVVAAIGLLWMALGAFFFADALVEEVRISDVYFVIPLLIDGGLSLAAGFNSAGTGRKVRFTKAAAFLAIALLVIFDPGHSAMIIGFVAGIYLVVDAVWRAMSAHVVRFRRWRLSLLHAGIEFLLGAWSFVPWPTQWQGEVGIDVGLLLMVSALGVCGLAWRILRMPPGTPMSRIMAHEGSREVASSRNAAASTQPRVAAIVHVWTPTGALAPIGRGVSRYVAALDEQGVISTGHAALEAPGFYVSHYPAAEIDRSAGDFRRTLRATRDNDVPGRFLPSYQEESAGWCPSTLQVRLPGLDLPAMRGFWDAYGADTTYNLTNRNCSSTVAAVIEAGLEGVFAAEARSPWFLLRLLLSPELWIAGHLRARTAAMAWTPGLVLDYARALSYLVTLPERPGRRPA
ncbi:protease [Roseococcus sp. SYP-B2431]|uniref:HdeD family acid-resistance protein n=1 Tax=Roseococcus sp. SYP-B2431 TaxID=2496640 RepID=UPI00103D03D3|nr:protease [Roseococcus sp. SYP-B2431]TCH97424.1 protease [Roseococcus sp. SYP-B2431]